MYWVRRLTILTMLIAAFTQTYPVAGQVVNVNGSPEATPPASSSPRFALVAMDEEKSGRFSDIEIAPGETRQLTVVVMNVGEVHASLRTFKANALVSINGGFVSDEETSAPFGSTEWIDYPTTELELGPGEQHEIAFTVRVPPDALPGQYISGLVVETAEALEIAGGGSLDQILAYSISIGILVPGELSYGFELGEPEVIESAGSQVVTIPLTNTGTYLLRPSGEIILRQDGEVVLRSSVEMGSVYAGLSTALEIILPDQMLPGDYELDLVLHDEGSGAEGSVENAHITVPEPVDPRGIFVASAIIEPNADEIVFANIDVTLENGGQQIPAANVTLEVMRDGESIEIVPLATNQVMLSGENQFTDRYIPEEMWESGTYTFNIKVSAVDPNGGQETVLVDEELDATIVVP